MPESIIHLQPSFFAESEKILVEHAGLTASSFLYPSGVHAIRLQNNLGQMTVLPFQGQQIWHLEFFGRTLTMQSMFEGPQRGAPYLQTYGAFLLHCGASAMGVAGPGDTHPLHGELPNAVYQTAQLVIGKDARGAYIAVTGTYKHTVAFAHNYRAQPVVKLYANSSRFPIQMNIHNLKRTPMELMYMAHANFRPHDHAHITYTAQYTPEHVRVRTSIPSHVKPAPGYREFLAELAANPSKHHVLEPGMQFAPEVVFFIDYLSDEHGWAHAMQILPNGQADLISHRPGELDFGVRWISRTPDQDCFGLNLPATAEPEGYTAEAAKGNIKILDAGATWTCNMEVAALDPDEAARMATEITRIRGQ
jgi:Domain of unknown function (DUF4432)